MDNRKVRKHCEGCAMFISAPKSKLGLWCCHKGSPAAKAIGWCKTHNAKRTKQP